MRGREGELLLANGQAQPPIDLASGTVERWRAVKTCVSRFIDRRLDRHTLGLLGYHGQALHDPIDRESVLLAPGNQVDLLVRADDAGPVTFRTISMTGGMGMGMGGTEFGFDGRTFDPTRADQRLTLGTVEEWTITNETMMVHPFHLHVWPMQLVSAPGSDATGPPDWRDVVIVPAHGQVTVRVPVRGLGGRTVYHCHILDHEDLAMMGVVDAR